MTVTPAGHLKVCFYLFFPAGGIGRYTRELASELGARDGIEVEVACSPDFRWREERGFSTWTGLDPITAQNPLARRARFLRGQFVNPLRFVDHVVRTRPDVVHFSNVNQLTLPLWRDRLARTGIPVAMTVHDVRRQKSIVLRPWEDRQLKEAYRFADVLFVHSMHQASELEDWAGVGIERIRVVPHGPYPHPPPRRERAAIRDDLGVPHDAHLVLFFGQLRDEKNLDGLIQALALVDDDVYLVAAGKGGSRHRSVDFYRDVARSASVSDRVVFQNRYIQDEEVGDFFSAADIVALPYRSSFTSQSGVLNVAAYYERPVLVGTAPVLSETVRSCDLGIVSRDDSADALASGLKDLRRRLEERHVHAFSEYKRRYSWRTNAELTVSAYEDLLRVQHRARAVGQLD